MKLQICSINNTVAAGKICQLHPFRRVIQFQTIQSNNYFKQCLNIHKCKKNIFEFNETCHPRSIESGLPAHRFPQRTQLITVQNSVIRVLTWADHTPRLTHEMKTADEFNLTVTTVENTVALI